MGADGSEVVGFDMGVGVEGEEKRGTRNAELGIMGIFECEMRNGKCVIIEFFVLAWGLLFRREVLF